MKESIAKRWVKALRSGEYLQGQNQLCIEGHPGEPDYFCCLGVLTDLYVRAGQPACDEWRLDGGAACLAPRVQKWARMKSRYGQYNYSALTLMEENDQGRTFSEIAAIIEAHWENL